MSTIAVEIAFARLRRAATRLDQLPPTRSTVIAGHIDNLDRTLPSALANLATNAPTGYSATAGGANLGDGSGTGGTVRSSVENAVTNRIGTPHGPSDDHTGGGTATAIERITRHLITATSHLTLACNDPVRANQHARCDIVRDELCAAIRIVNDWHTIEIRHKIRLTCNCGQLDGWLEWGDLDCGLIAAPGTNGLCSGTRPDGTPGCHQRRDAWRKRQEYQRRRIDPRTRQVSST